MTAYVQQHLVSDEAVIYQTKLHRIIYLMPTILTLAGLALLVFTIVRLGVQHLNVAGHDLPVYPVAGAAVLLVGLLALLIAWVRRQTSEFAVTNKRLIVKTGWISRRTIEMNMSRVESIEVQQGVAGRFMDYGTIVVIGTGGTKEPFAVVDHPLTFRHAVQEQQG